MKKILILIGIFILNINIFTKNIVITSIQSTYSLVSYLTKETSIETHIPFDSDVSMLISKDVIRDSKFKLDIAKDSQAVVDIAKIWKDDIIYGKAREENIRIIEIDASHSYNEKMPTLFFSEYSNGEINPYVWTGSKNIIKMGNIVARDLVRIYPKEKNKIEKNLLELTREVVKLEKEANEKLLDCNSVEVISLTEDLQYFFNDLNILVNYEKYEDINENNIKDTMEKYGVKTVVSTRWVKKKVVKAIEEAGGNFIVLNNLDIPYDLNGQMDPEALLKAYEENVDKLVESLTK